MNPPMSIYEYMKLTKCEYDVYDVKVDNGSAAGITDDPTDAYGCVVDFILKNVMAVKSNGYEVVGDFWGFVDQHYDEFMRIFVPDLVRDIYAMEVQQKREENIFQAVDCIIEIIKGNAGNDVYARFLMVFDLVPEDHVVYDFEIMDIEEMLARKERKAQEGYEE